MNNRQLYTIHLHGTLAANASGVVPMPAHVGATLLEVAATASNVNSATLALGVGGVSADADGIMTDQLIGQSGVPEIFVVGDFNGALADPLGTSCPRFGPQELLTWNLNYNGTGANEQQRISLTRGPSGGTFTLTYSGQTTSAIAWNASAATVAAALKALSNIADADITVTGDAGGPWTVTFIAGMAETNIAEMTGNAASLTGGDNEVQSVTITGAPTGGTFTLTYSGQTTGAIAFDAAASAVQTALRALSNLTPAKVSVTGPVGGPWLVEFIDTLAATDVAAMTASAGGLTGGSTPGVTIATPTVGSVPVLTVTTLVAGTTLTAAANVDLVFTLLLGNAHSHVSGITP